MGEAPAATAIVPSRGRPGRLAEMIGEFGRTAVCCELVICLDDDDPAAGGYDDLAGQPLFSRYGISWRRGPRRTLTGWTNTVAAEYAASREMLVTLGDDHRPVTPGWDRKFLDAIRATGGGWAYGDDGLQGENLPTAFGVSGKVVAALEWMLLPGCAHMFVDAAARDLAGAARRLSYLPGVKIPHLHFTSGLSPHDQTYADSYASWDADNAAYQAWLGDPPGTGQIRADAGTVRRTCA